VTLTRLHTMYAGRSTTYDALVTRYGKYMPEASAERFATDHGVTLDELGTEIWWGDFTPEGVGTTVNVASLLFVLGY
jgi:hypothetical protein